LVVEPPNLVFELLRQRRVHPCDRLVEQQHLRLGEHRPRELDELHLTAGDVGRGLCREVVDLEIL